MSCMERQATQQSLQHTATHCNTLQQSLQHTATSSHSVSRMLLLHLLPLATHWTRIPHLPSLEGVPSPWGSKRGSSIRDTECESVAVSCRDCCSVLQCVAVALMIRSVTWGGYKNFVHSVSRTLLGFEGVPAKYE